MRLMFWRKQDVKSPIHIHDPHLYHIGGVWGDAVRWSSWEARKVVGWKARRPIIGDYLTSTMESGRRAVFQFTKVEYMGDPPDMFFGEVTDLNYVDVLLEQGCDPTLSILLTGYKAENGGWVKG